MPALEGRWPGFMTAVLPGNLEQRQAFSAEEKRPVPTSLGMLGGLASCDAQ